MAESESVRSLQARYEMAVKRIALLEKLVANLEEQVQLLEAQRDGFKVFLPTNPTQEDE